MHATLQDFLPIVHMVLVLEPMLEPVLELLWLLLALLDLEPHFLSRLWFHHQHQSRQHPLHIGCLPMIVHATLQEFLSIVHIVLVLESVLESVLEAVLAPVLESELGPVLEPKPGLEIELVLFPQLPMLSRQPQLGKQGLQSPSSQGLHVQPQPSPKLQRRVGGWCSMCFRKKITSSRWLR